MLQTLDDIARTTPAADGSATGLLPVLPVETGAMVTRDGTRLDADIYRPAQGGPYPVLLMRQAYGRRIACTICYAHPAWYAAHGYVVVIQDMRGRGTSEGVFRAGEDDVSDGAETVAWASRLPGTTGDVGMYGFSYQGYNQLLATIAAGPALKALAPAMGPWHPRKTWAFENGALRLGGTLGWATQVAADCARHKGDAAAYAELMTESRSLNTRGAVQARPEYMERHRALSHYHRWLDTPDDDPYWRDISPAAHVEAIAAKQLPMLFIGGWYDSHLSSVLMAMDDLRCAGNPNLKLVIGPWTHFPWDRKAGAVDFGPDAASRMDELHIRWFDHWLKGKSNGVMSEAPIRLFDLGAHAWRDHAEWPRQSITFALSGTGKAAIDVSDGKLTSEAAAAAGIDYVVHDPWRPAPAVGGAFGSPPGAIDRTNVDSRGDVATFTTAPLDAPLTLVGDVAADLYLSSDAVSFDVNCVLSRVTASGQVFQVAEGHCRVTDPDENTPVHIPMRATCVTLMPGDALRLSIAGASFPAYAINPGTGDDPTTTPSVKAQVITLGIRYGDAQQSTLTVGGQG